MYPLPPSLWENYTQKKVEIALKIQIAIHRGKKDLANSDQQVN